jgi:hypothetical protein
MTNLNSIQQRKLKRKVFEKGEQIKSETKGRRRE